MHSVMDTWDWFWMVFMAVSWIVIVGVLAYVAIELLKQQPPRLRHH